MTLQVGFEGKGSQAGIGRKEPVPMTGFVEALVESAFGISRSALRTPGRGTARVAFARQVAIYLSHVHLGLTYSAAGRFFGRDRTTAAHACGVIEERRENASLDSLLDCLERAIDIRRRSDAWSDRA